MILSFGEWLEPKVLVAIYAAILSTINFLMTIISKRRNLRIKLVIKQEIQYPVQSSIFPVTQIPSISIEIVNKSKINIFVDKVFLKSETQEILYQDKSRRIVFPKELKLGDKLECKINLYNVNKETGIEINNLQAIVFDSLNRKYKSNTISKKELLREIEIAREKTKIFKENFIKGNHI